MSPDHGLGKKARDEASSSGQTCPVAITARSNDFGSGSPSVHRLTPSGVAAMSITGQDSLTVISDP
ncbi:hypothetical protein D3C78_1889410 [compost metagenome]